MLVRERRPLYLIDNGLESAYLILGGREMVEIIRMFQEEDDEKELQDLADYLVVWYREVRTRELNREE